MALRALVLTQMTCVALLGMATRGALLTPSSRGWAESAAAFAFYPVLVGFPSAVLFTARYAALPSWKRRVIMGIEVALVYATLVAILPAVQ